MAGGCIWHQFDYAGETYDPVDAAHHRFRHGGYLAHPQGALLLLPEPVEREAHGAHRGALDLAGRGGAQAAVKVYSNAEEVELFVNGRSLGRQGKGSYEGLAHPPRIWEVSYEPGTLLAVGHWGDRERRDERKTAGAPYQIVLTADAQKLRSGDPESLAYLTAVVADRAGVVVPDAHPPISFTLYGPGELLEQTWPPYGTGLTWNAVAGMTRIALRATARSGQAIVSASSPGLKMGRTHVDIGAPGKPDEMDYKERFAVDELP